MFIDLRDPWFTMLLAFTTLGGVVVLTVIANVRGARSRAKARQAQEEREVGPNVDHTRTEH
ncbi:MAG: hypothetical protein ACFB9M_16215 [Myxococcota bacterium]